LGLFYPRVDQYYRDYFITRHANCLLSSDLAEQIETALRVNEIQFGKLDANSACFVLRGGWAVPSSAGVWSVARTASFELPVAGHSLTLTVQLAAATNPQQVNVFVEGKFYQTVLLPSGTPEKLRVDLPAGVAGTVTISFHMGRPQDTKDDRRLPGIGLVSAVWN
jgi:hypothetical protein